LKKETRILGLSAASTKNRPIPLVGVIFRGSLWLDGIMTCAANPKKCDTTTQLADAIIHSRHYTQIRAVIISVRCIHEPELDPEALSHKISLPTIVHRPVSPRIRSKAYRFQFRGRYLTVQIFGGELNMVRDFYNVACRAYSSVPEALSVADLIAKNLPTSTIGKKSSNA